MDHNSTYRYKKDRSSRILNNPRETFLSWMNNNSHNHYNNRNYHNRMPHHHNSIHPLDLPLRLHYHIDNKVHPHPDRNRDHRTEQRQ